MRPYRASNKAPFSSLFLLLIVALVAGAALGGILFAVEYYTSFYLVLLFPVLAGFLAGGALAWAVRAGKVRSPFVAAFFGLVAGLVILATYHAASYFIGFRSDVREALVEQGEENISDVDLDAFIDTNLKREYGEGGFIGFLRLAADEGFSITRTASSSSSGIDLQGDAVWIYWGVELVIAMIAAAVAARGAAVQPFDESSGEWYEGAELVGRASNKARKDLLNAFKDGRYPEAGRMLTRGEMKYPAIEVTTRRSPDRSAQDIYVAVNYVQRQGRSSAIKTGIVSPSELDMLVRAMTAADAQGMGATATATAKR
jgi:hypothetical protein